MRLYVVNYMSAGNYTFSRYVGFFCVHIPQYNDYDFHGVFNGKRHLPDAFAQIDDVFENPERFYRVLRTGFDTIREKMNAFKEREVLVTSQLNQLKRR